MEFLIGAAFALYTAAAPASLAVPGRANANPSAAADGRTVAVAWAASEPGGATDIYVAVSRDGGGTFGDPVRVNDIAGDARVSGEQPPRLIVRTPNRLAVAWVSTRDGTTIRVAQSADGGRTFAPSIAVSQAGAPGNRGWHAMDVNARGDIEVVWLDHRAMAGHEHHHTAGAGHGTRDGAAMARLSAIYAARVRADGRVEPERQIATGVCYCCKTAIAAVTDGSIVAAWRHVYAGNFRDIAFTRAADGRRFAAPLRVSADEWRLDGCPDDGPAIAVDGGNRTHLVWPTRVTENGEPTIALFYAQSRDGRTFTERQRLPTEGVAHHPQLVVRRDGGVQAVWDESGDGARTIASATANVDGRGVARFTRVSLDGVTSASYPALAAGSDGVVLAWSDASEDPSTIRVTRLGSTSMNLARGATPAR